MFASTSVPVLPLFDFGKFGPYEARLRRPVRLPRLRYQFAIYRIFGKVGRYGARCTGVCVSIDFGTGSPFISFLAKSVDMAPASTFLCVWLDVGTRSPFNSFFIEVG